MKNFHATQDNINSFLMLLRLRFFICTGIFRQKRFLKDVSQHGNLC